MRGVSLDDQDIRPFALFQGSCLLLYPKGFCRHSYEGNRWSLDKEDRLTENLSGPSCQDRPSFKEEKMAIFGGGHHFKKPFQNVAWDQGESRLRCLTLLLHIAEVPEEGVDIRFVSCKAIPEALGTFIGDGHAQVSNFLLKR